jgi:hypothetical protein
MGFLYLGAIRRKLAQVALSCLKPQFAGFPRRLVQFLFFDGVTGLPARRVAPILGLAAIPAGLLRSGPREIHAHFDRVFIFKATVAD